MCMAKALIGLQELRHVLVAMTILPCCCAAPRFPHPEAGSTRSLARSPSALAVRVFMYGLVSVGMCSLMVVLCAYGGRRHKDMAHRTADISLQPRAAFSQDTHHTLWCRLVQGPPPNEEQLSI